MEGHLRQYRVFMFIYSDGGSFMTYRVLRFMYSDGGSFRAYRVFMFIQGVYVHLHIFAE